MKRKRKVVRIALQSEILQKTAIAAATKQKSCFFTSVKEPKSQSLRKGQMITTSTYIHRTQWKN